MHIESRILRCLTTLYKHKNVHIIILRFEFIKFIGDTVSQYLTL